MRSGAKVGKLITAASVAIHSNLFVQHRLCLLKELKSKSLMTPCCAFKTPVCKLVLKKDKDRKRFLLELTQYLSSKKSCNH